MAEYLGKVHVLLHDFKELLSPASTPSQELEQQSKLFMLLALHELLDDYSHVHLDFGLPSWAYLYFHLFHPTACAKSTIKINSLFSSDDFSVLVS